MGKEEISGNVVDFKVLKRLLQYAKPYVRQFYLVVILTVLLAVISPVRPFLIQHTVDTYLIAKDISGVSNMIMIMIGLLLLQTYMQYIHTYLSSWLGQNIIRDIRVKLYDHIQQLKLKFFDKTPIGRLVTRNVSDIETLADVFSQGIAALIGDLLQLIAILAVMFWTNWKLTLVSLATFPLLMLSTYVFKERIKSSFNNVRTAVANLNTFVQEHITGMSIVQIFNSEEREYKRFKDINAAHRRANLKSVLYYSIYFPVAEVIQAASIGLVVWFGAREALNETLSIGVLVAFIMYIQMFFRPIRMIADRFNTLQMGIVSSNRIFNLLDNRTYIDRNGDLDAIELNGSVTFKNVWFAYTDDNFILKDLTFEIEAGKTLAIVGATGAGKSSTINLLNRFYEINKGEILVDQKNITDYDLSYLRQHIGVVQQDVFLFSDSIERNITLGDPTISLEDIRSAAQLVGALNFIEQLPGSFQYNVQERGSTLSVGQRQLISFVRAMVHNPKILILDEATSSVDSETEAMIQRATENIMRGRTSIVIAHRLSTVQNADKIIVLDQGEIVEVGNHEELIKMDGYYSKLQKMQFNHLIV